MNINFNYLTQYIIAVFLVVFAVFQSAVNIKFRKNNKLLNYTNSIILILSIIVLMGEGFNVFTMNNVFVNIQLANFIGIISVLYLLVSVNLSMNRELYFKNSYNTEMKFFSVLACIFAFLIQFMSKVGNVSGEALILICISIGLTVIFEYSNVIYTKKYAALIYLNLDEYTKRVALEYEKTIEKSLYTSKHVNNKIYNSSFGGNFIVLSFYFLQALLFSLLTLGIAFPKYYCKYQTYKIKNVKINGLSLKFIGQYKKLTKIFLKWWIASVFSLFVFTPILVYKLEQWKISNCIIDETIEKEKKYIIKRKIYRKIFKNNKEITVYYSSKPEFEKKDIYYSLKFLIAVSITLLIILL